MKHRTQIPLDEQQYRTLEEMARSRGRSMGQIVRDLIDEGIARDRNHDEGRLDALRQIAGFIGEPDVTGREHDSVLYDEEQHR